jgi:hypothetical protein
MYILSEPDLDASVEMLAFMWIALGNDPSSVRPQERLLVRMAIAQNFPQLTPDVQLLFAQARTNYAVMQADWDDAGPQQRQEQQREFLRLLTLLGLIPHGGSAAPTSINNLQVDGAWKRTEASEGSVNG